MNAYCGPPPTPMSWLAQWNADPAVIAGLALLLWVGATRLRDEPARRHMLFAAVAVLALLLVSPLCALTVALFSARIVHHLLLVTAAAPLLALALPRAMPAVGPALGLALSAVTFWAWHVPMLYSAALGSTAIYWAMQASLLLTALLFWRAVFAAGPSQGLIAIVAAAAQMGLLGALLVFAPAPLYAPHLASTVPWGIGPLADQQLGGLLMWVPGMLPYALCGGLLALRGWRTAAS